MGKFNKESDNDIYWAKNPETQLPKCEQKNRPITHIQPWYITQSIIPKLMTLNENSSNKPKFQAWDKTGEYCDVYFPAEFTFV